MLDVRHPRQPLSFACCALASWRLTHLIVEEDGPADIVLRLRRVAGDGTLGRIMDCFYCASMWVALPFAAAAAVTGSTPAPAPRRTAREDRAARPARGIVTWLALSGAACLLERATHVDEPAEIAVDGGAMRAAPAVVWGAAA